MELLSHHDDSIAGVHMWVYVILAVPLTVLGIGWMRKDYRDRGRLGIPAFITLLVMFFIPHLALHDSFDYAFEPSGRLWVGLVIVVLGLAFCVWGIVTFRSLAKVFTFDPGTLSTSGPYRWSRNPQYVGWAMFFVGFAIMGSRAPVIPLGIFVVVLHFLVLGEEEHLERVFGEDYREFKRRVPRWVGFGKAADNG